MIEGLLLTPLKVIENPKGDIYHALKSSSSGYEGFGEVYFSSVLKGQIKGWKRHKRLALNIVVPYGEIQFYLFDDKKYYFYDVTIGIKENYKRITIPSGVWVAFKGKSEFNLLMNFIAEEHDPDEADNKDLSAIPLPI